MIFKKLKEQPIINFIRKFRKVCALLKVAKNFMRFIRLNSRIIRDLLHGDGAKRKQSL